MVQGVHKLADEGRDSQRNGLRSSRSVSFQLQTLAINRGCSAKDSGGDFEGDEAPDWAQRTFLRDDYPLCSRDWAQGTSLREDEDQVLGWEPLISQMVGLACRLEQCLSGIRS